VLTERLATQSLLKKFSQQPSHQAARLSVESGKYTFHYLIDQGVCYLTLTEKAYPKKLAFQYLEELTNEFSRLYGQQVHTVSRPYAFIKFGEPHKAGPALPDQHVPTYALTAHCTEQ
jgi:hypothetical protein